MEVFPIPMETRRRARAERPKEHPKMGETLGVGATAERMVAALINAERAPAEDFDLLLPDGTRIDVVPTRGPLEFDPYDGVRVHAEQEEVRRIIAGCDVFFFVRMTGFATKIAYLGWIPVTEFFAKAEFVPQGSDDPFRGNAVRADCFALDVKSLRPLEALLNQKGSP